MPEYTLPVPSPMVGNFFFETSLENVGYIFRFQWNSRDVAWYFDIYAIDQTPIAQGLKVVLGTYIGRRVDHPLFTNGIFVAVDNGPNQLDATFDDFGTRVVLKYITIAELLVRLNPPPST